MGFDSLNTGISGLDAYQSQIDLISNNLANAGTVGFKGQNMTFADMFYQNTGFASAPTQQRGGVNPQEVGLGVKVNTTDTNFSQGGFNTTGVNTNLAINGDGFFILGNLDGSSQPVYTRDGNFQLNSNGVLYDPATGLAVKGYMANAQGQVSNGTALTNLTFPIGLKAEAVGTGFGTKVGPSTNDSVFDVAMGGMLDQTQWQTEEQGIITGKGAGQGQSGTTSTTIYDSLGNAHEMYVKYVPDATGATPASVSAGGAGLNVTGGACITSGTIIAGASANTVTVTSNGPGNGYKITDTNGNSLNATAGSTVSFDGATLTLATPEPAAATAQTFTITGATTGLPASVNDANGNAHTPATRYKVEVYFTDGTQINGQTVSSSTPATIGYAYYDNAGQFINTSSSLNPTTGTVHQTGNQPSVVAGDEINITGWGQVNGNVAVAPTGTGTPATGPIGLDFSGTTALGEQSTSSGTSGYSLSVISQNGAPSGILSNITIGQDGTVTGAFTNGQTKTLGEVALATFQNEQGLERVGGNGFQQTSNSGLAQVGTAASGRFGSILSGSLEQSNVSLADEFTKMIVAQRAFEANSRGISTADQNLIDLINLRASEN
jgi:flagellar hook protein FlgE